MSCCVRRPTNPPRTTTALFAANRGRVFKNSKVRSYLRQHHALEAPEVSERAFRQAWRVRTRVDRLLVDKAISWAEWRCAVEYRALYECAFGSLTPASRPDGTGRGGAYRAGLRPSDRQLAALRQLQKLLRQLDRPTVQLLEAVIVEDVKWCVLGKRLGAHSCTARRWAVAAIKLLATAWSGPR